MESLRLSFMQLHPTGGDETAPYGVTTNRGCTLKELIETIKSGTSHGEIWIYAQDGLYVVKKYERHPIEDFPTALMGKGVKRITAAGGWGRMDYRIWV